MLDMDASRSDRGVIERRQENAKKLTKTFSLEHMLLFSVVIQRSVTKKQNQSPSFFALTPNQGGRCGEGQEPFELYGNDCSENVLSLA